MIAGVSVGEWLALGAGGLFAGVHLKLLVSLTARVGEVAAELKAQRATVESLTNRVQRVERFQDAFIIGAAE